MFKHFDVAYVGLKVQRKMLCARQRQLKMENNAFPGSAVDNLQVIYFFSCLAFKGEFFYYFTIMWGKNMGKNIY